MDNMLIAIYQGFVDEMHNTLWPTLFKHDNGELFRFIVYNKYVTSIKLLIILIILFPFKLTELHLFAFFN